MSFEELEVPQLLGTVIFQPTVESVKKFAYAVEDESGWFIGDPTEGLVHPVFLSTYMWWPSGFYIREPGAVGHFSLFHERFAALVGRPHLHAKTKAQFMNPFRIGMRLRADVTLAEKFQKRARDFIVLRADFRNEDEMMIATYEHTVAIRSHAAKA